MECILQRYSWNQLITFFQTEKKKEIWFDIIKNVF